MIMLLRTLLFSLVAIGGRVLTISRRRSYLESPVVEIAYAGYQGALEGNVQRFLSIPYPQPQCLFRTLEGVSWRLILGLATRISVFADLSRFLTLVHRDNYSPL